MADKVDRLTRSRIMARVSSKDTLPEMVVRRTIHAAGFRFRLHCKALPGKPDLVFPRYKIVVFVHGCFWHWHGCKRSRMPATNEGYWVSKIERNVRRDKENRMKTEALGWKCRVIWECELRLGIESLLEELKGLRE